MDQENSEDQSQFGRQRERLILFILAAVQFTSIVDFMIVMPLGPQLMRKLQIDTAQYGLIVSSYTFAAGVAGLVASSLVDRYARRTTFMILYTGFLIGTFLCAVSPDYLTLVAARIITGAFGGILGGIAMTIVGDVFPEERRGRATGMLMAGFAVASVVGVPFGLFLGTNFGWQVPFVVLALGGVPILLLTPFALPALNSHVDQEHAHPLRALFETFTVPNHLKAFALSIALMLGSFSVFPYVSAYFVANVGLTEQQLPIIYIVGGALTLFAAPVIGKLADRFGKLRIYRIIAPLSALLLVAITSLPRVHLVIAVAVFGALMLCNVGRMIAATAMITGSVEPRRRGGFMSANSSVQHLACGVAASLGGFITNQAENATLTNSAPIEHFEVVGWIAAAFTFATLWLAGRVRIVDVSPQRAQDLSLAAAAEAAADAPEPLVATVEH